MAQGRRSLWDGGHVLPPIFMKGDVHGNVPQYLGVYFSSNSNNCCLLYFDANIMCSFTKNLASGPPTRAPPLTPAAGLPTSVPRPPVFFYVLPNNPVRSTPLVWHHYQYWCTVNATRLMADYVQKRLPPQKPEVRKITLSSEGNWASESRQQQLAYMQANTSWSYWVCGF